MKIFDQTMAALSKSLDLRSQRQNIISANIANAETPGYKAQRLDFEEALTSALDMEQDTLVKTHPGHMSEYGSITDIEGEIYNNPNNVVREDGNTVDRDAELVELSQNQLLFTASTEALKRKLALIKYAISEGGR